MAAHATADGRTAPGYGTTQAVDSLGSGVRNMSVMEHNGGYPPPAPPSQQQQQPQPQGGAVPMSGVLNQAQASQQQSLLRSNSFQ